MAVPRIPADSMYQAAVDAPLGRELLLPDSEVNAGDGWYQVVTPSSHGSSRNEVILSRVEASEAESVIDQTIATYRALGKPTKWCVGPWTEPWDFGTRLAARGFDSWAVRGMACDARLDLATPDVDVARVTLDDLDSYVTVACDGWGLPADAVAVEREFVRSILEDRNSAVQLFMARFDGAVVGTAGLVLKDGYGYLTGAQVLTEARGRGLYRAFIAARLEALRKHGRPFAVTQAREATSAPILEHLGFQTVFRSRCYLLDAT